MEKDRLFQLLEEIQPLPTTFKKALTNELQSVEFPKGHFLVQALSTSTHAYFLDEGFAVSYHDRNGKRIVTAFWKAGEIIVSPRSFFERKPSNENIQLTIPGKLRTISLDATKNLFEKFPIGYTLALVIVSRYHARSEERIVDLHRLDSWEIYTKLINTYPGIELNTAQALIASYLNITAQSLSRLKAERIKT